MSAGFDAYHKWLGILPKDQPPHHYRLLGLEAFESDPDVIEGAADRQLSSLRRYQSGEHASLASKLLNEVAQARLCLLKPESKQRYDEELRERLDPTAAFQVAVQPETAGKSAVISKRRPAAISPPPVWKKPAVMGGAAAACVLVVVGILMLSPSAKSDPKPKARSRDDSASDSLTKASEAVAKKSAKSAKPASDDKPPSKGSSSGEVAAGPTINLLKPLDLQKQKIRGEITTGTNGILRFGNESGMRLPTHGPIPDDYRLEITAERPEGVEALFLIFPCGGCMTSLALDGWNGAHSGLWIDGRSPESNCTTHTGMALAPNRTNEISIVVHPGMIRVSCNGEVITDWRGNPERLLADPNWVGLPGKDELLLCTSRAPYLISRFELTPLRERAAEKPTEITKPVDLIRDANVARDTWLGKWIRDRSGLQSVNAGRAGIQLGEDFPDEYTLVVRTKRPLEQKGLPTLVMGFPAGESLAEFVFDVNDCSGLEMLDGRRWDNSVTRIPGIQLRGGPEHEVRITVLKRRIALEVDGRRILDWAGDFGRLSAPGEWVGPRSRCLTIGVDFDYTIKAARLEPPQKLPEPPKEITTPIDVLKQIKTSRDTYWGDWTLEEGMLKSPPTEDARLVLPTLVPDEYTLTVDVTKQAGGRDDALLVGLPMGDHFVVLAMDCAQSTKSGIELDDLILANSTGRDGRVFEPGKTRTLVCSVSRNGIRVECDGKPLTDWRGNPCRRMVHPLLTASLHRRTFLTTWNTSYHFSRIELAPNPKPMTVPERPKVAMGENLIGAILPDLDSQRGEWKLSDGSLISPPVSGARLPLPIDPPPRYSLSLLVERIQGPNEFLAALPVGGYPGAVMIDGYGARISGIDTIDHQRPDLNPTRREGQILPQGKTVQLDYIVTPDSVRVLADGSQIIDWKGDPRRLSPSPSFAHLALSSGERSKLAIGSWETQFKISQIVLRPEATSNETPPRLAQTPLPKPKASGAKVPGLQTVPHPADQKLLLILIASERAVAEKYCAAHQLNYELADSFDMNRQDYSEDYAIIVGSNMMDYWGASEERKKPEAFDAIDRWVQRGGHLIVCSAFNGRNSEQLQRYGIQTGTQHEDFFAPVPGVTDVLLQGNEALVPPKNRLRSACNFVAQQPHATLLYRADGKQPVMTTQPRGKGRVTYTSIEPEFMEGQWFLDVLVSWASRGGPVPKSAWPASAATMAGAAGESGRLPVPDQSEQREAKKVLRSIFKAEYDKIQQNASKLAIAEGLLSQDLSAETPTVRYTAWNESKDLAIAIGDLPLAVRAIRQLESDFEVDGLEEQIEAINSVAKGSRDAAVAVSSARATLDLMPRLFAENRYDLAKKTAATARTLAQKGKDKPLAALAVQYEKETKTLGEGFAAIRSALKTIDEHPEDAEANQKLGEFYCFVKEDWDAGLPYLAAGNDSRTKSLAEMELAHPETSKEQNALAIAWGTYADVIPNPQRPVPRRRARHWWQRAWSAADGLAKSAIEKNLAKLPSTPMTLQIVVDVDGSDDMVISAAGLRWNHLTWSPPKAVQVNSQVWNLAETTFLPNVGASRILPDDLNFLGAEIKQVRGRGTTSIRRSPDHIVIHFEDSEAGGSDIFEVLVNFPK